MKGHEQSEVVLVLREVQSLLRNNETASLAVQVGEELQRALENHFYLVVLGQFKRGKTTFLNALLGEDLLPAGVLPLTAVLTLIRHGSHRQIRVVFNNDQRREIQANELADFIAEQKNPGNVKQVRYVEIAHPCPILRDGLVLVDTPGVGSLFQHNTQLTKQFIPKVDAAVLIISTDPPITQAEYEFLDEVVQHVDKVLIVLNKTDRLREADLREMLEYTKSVIRSKLPNENVKLHPLSALLALEGKKMAKEEMVARSGIRELERKLTDFLVNERSQVLDKQSRRRVHSLLSKANFELELELKAAQMPLMELETKIGEFEKRIAQLLREREEFAYLIHGEVKSLERWVDEQLERFSTAEIALLKETLFLWASELPTSSFGTFFRPLEARFEKRIVEDFERFRTQFEPVLMERYEAITARYVQKTNQFIESILRLSQGLFAASVQPIVSIEPIRWQKRFYYNTQNEALFLEFDFLKMFSMLLPRSIVRRWSLKRLLKSVEEKVPPVCNGLKYEYSYSLQETYRHFQSELNQQIDEIIDEVRRILQQAKERKSATEENVKVYVETLSHRLDRLAELQRLVLIP
jgi:GTP-binding protein EngB required for normal cell division